MDEHGIRLADVTKRFDGATAVRDVSLTVDPDELLVLVGPSGCGKTTVLRLIAGLESPTDGDVFIDGERVTDVPARKRDVALVFQDFALFPHMNVRENLSFNLRMQGYDDVDARVERVADLLGIVDLLERGVGDLSGGQQQRVALGRAIATEPRAFLLDEPLANLDEQLRERMQTEIARLQDRIGTTTVHVTHNQAEAMTMGDRIAVMEAGEIQQIGTPEAVYGRPANLFVARFIGSPTMNLLRGTPHPGAGEVGLDGVDVRLPAPLETDDAVYVGIRPEAIDVRTDGPGDVAADRLSAAVGYVEFRGSDRFLYVQPLALPELVVRTAGNGRVDEGTAVSLGFPRDALHFFDAESGERLSPTGD